MKSISFMICNPLHLSYIYINRIKKVRKSVNTNKKSSEKRIYRIIFYFFYEYVKQNIALDNTNFNIFVY